MVGYMLCQVAILFDRDGGNKMAMVAKAATWPLLSIVGFACWWGTTETSYGGDCDAEDYLDSTEDGDRWEVCAGGGATVGIVAFAFMVLAGILGIVNSFM